VISDVNNIVADDLLSYTCLLQWTGDAGLTLLSPSFPYTNHCGNCGMVTLLISVGHRFSVSCEHSSPPSVFTVWFEQNASVSTLYSDILCNATTFRQNKPPYQFRSCETRPSFLENSRLYYSLQAPYTSDAYFKYFIVLTNNTCILYRLRNLS